MLGVNRAQLLKLLGEKKWVLKPMGFWIGGGNPFKRNPLGAIFQGGNKGGPL